MFMTKKALIVGCSLTAGFKLHKNTDANTSGHCDPLNPRIWANKLLSQLDDFEILNLSEAGVNNNWIFMEAMSALTQTHYDLVLIQWTFLDRLYFPAGLELYDTNTMLAGSIANNKLAGSITNDKLVNSSVTVNGTAIALGASGTVTAAAGTLTGTTLNSTVVTSSLTAIAGMSTIIAGTLAIDPGNINKNTSSTQTFTLNGLTTSHKIIITPATVMPDRNYAIRGAWASATDTLSVEIVNNSGDNIDARYINLCYIALV
jgi:hypothetical protein